MRKFSVLDLTNSRVMHVLL